MSTSQSKHPGVYQNIFAAHNAVGSYPKAVFNDAVQATYHPKTNLLICRSPASPDESFALVGFSASAHPVVKEYVLKQRKQHLRLLEGLDAHDLPWAIGNCAEVETFAHIEPIQRQFSRTITDLDSMVAITLTLDLKDQTTHGPCKQCSQLIRKLRLELPCAIFSLAPLKRGNMEPYSF